MKKQDHHMVQQVLDGEMTPEQFDAFQERLRSEPELQELYQGYALLHHTLSEEFEGGFPVSDAPAHPGWSAGRILLLLGIAAALALAVLVFGFKPWENRSAGADPAVLTFSLDAVWNLNGRSRNLGGATGVDAGTTLRLDQGRAAVSLEPSVSALIEGPAILTFLDKDSMHLESGIGFFRRGGSGGALTVSTPRITVVDEGTEFGLEVPASGLDELHVMEGRVEVRPKTGDSLFLAGGDAVRVNAAGLPEPMTSDGRTFAKNLGRFQTLETGPFERPRWRVEYGNPSLTTQRIEGSNYAVFFAFPEPVPLGENSVLLVTLDVGKPVGADFHTDGWAGMSFFRKGEEMLFFGDSFGTKSTWSLDVKQRIPVILPEKPVVGPGMVTLRYDLRRGDITLHEGGLPLKAPFCRGKLPPGTRFDEIRLGASAGAALTVDSLKIRSGGG